MAIENLYQGIVACVYRKKNGFFKRKLLPLCNLYRDASETKKQTILMPLLIVSSPHTQKKIALAIVRSIYLWECFVFFLVRCTYTFVHLVLLCITEFSYMNDDDVDSYFDALSLAFTIHLDRYTIQWPFLGVCLCVCVHTLPPPPSPQLLLP